MFHIDLVLINIMNYSHKWNGPKRCKKGVDGLQRRVLDSTFKMEGLSGKDAWGRSLIHSFTATVAAEIYAVYENCLFKMLANNVYLVKLAGNSRYNSSIIGPLMDEC